MIKEVLKNIIPDKLITICRNLSKLINSKSELKKAYKYDLRRYLSYSDTYTKIDPSKLSGRIIRQYHVVEKGLTMPDLKLGFGKNVILDLSNNCIDYVNKYGMNDEQVIHAINVINEYYDLHSDKKYPLDKNVLNAINNVKALNAELEKSSQRETSRDEYFSKTNMDFEVFSNSRSSVRNFNTDDLPLEKIINALELAKNTPSACNRQCWRTNVFSDKDKIRKILEIQGGTRGFGHLTNKLIVISAEISVFTSVSERNEAFIDGGMYAMNLLYALHYNQVAACILNCSNDIEDDLKMRAEVGINDSEVFIAMIACGIPPEKFKIASSHRYDIDKTNTCQ